MIAWWRSIGWAILAAAVGIAVLGLTGNDGWLEEADRSARSGIARSAFVQEFGFGWEWQEHQRREKVWLWQGFQRLEPSQAPVRVIELDEAQSEEFSHELMGPVSLSVLMAALTKQESAVVLRYWPLSWAQSQQISLQALQKSLEKEHPVVAAFALDWALEPRSTQQVALTLLKPLPGDVPAEMDLLEVNAASLGWPQHESLPKVLWAGVPTAILADYEREGVVMRVPLLLRSKQQLLASLPLVAAMDAMDVRASDLRFEAGASEEQYLLNLGENFSLLVDGQGRLAVPIKVLDAQEELLPRMSLDDFLPLLHEVELPALASHEVEQEQLKRHLASAEVLWFDEANHQTGLSEAKALAQILRPSSQVQERELRVNRPLGAITLVFLALVLARVKRRSHQLEGFLAISALLFLVFVSYLALIYGQWWVSPLPGAVVLVLVLFFRERQRWVQAARENLLAEQRVAAELDEIGHEAKPKGDS